MPDEESRTSGSANAWIWVVDYQLAAHKLQTELYGQSNITLNEGRTSIIDVYRGANYKGDYSNNSSNTVSTTLSNNSYVPQTTENQYIPDTTEEITTEIDNSEPVTEDTTVEVPDSTENVEIPDTTVPISETSPTPPSSTEVISPNTEVAA